MKSRRLSVARLSRVWREGAFSHKVKGLSTAAVRELGAHYPWMRHEARARQAGVREAAIEAIRAKGGFSGFTPREKTAGGFTRTLMSQHELPDELFARMEEELATPNLSKPSACSATTSP